MREVVQVFLSSTARDLAEHREAVFRAINGMDGYQCVRMEDFGSWDSESEAFCRRTVVECDLVVFLIGPLYGSEAPSGMSFTESEYRAALEADRPHLVFLTADDFRVAATLHERDEKHQKQVRLRQTLGSRVAAHFDDPKDLAAHVVRALRNWERQASRPEPRASASGPRSGPDLGPLAGKLCDRQLQSRAFDRFFREHHRERPGRPQAWFIHGESGQEHESLVERFEYRVRELLGDGNGARAAVRSLRIEWPVGGGQVALDHLQGNIVARFDRRAEDCSAAALSRHLRDSKLSGVTIHHRLEAATWTAATTALLDSYLGFWEELDLGPSDPQVLVFLSVIYAPGPLVWWSRLLPTGLRHDARIAVGAALARLVEGRGAKGTLACRVLEELPAVRQEDVMQWFFLNNIDDAEVRQRTLSRIFGTAGSSALVPMARVQRELEEVVKACRREDGD
jgi:Domain of unknown function (DUF4062)/inactive STAND